MLLLLVIYDEVPNIVNYLICDLSSVSVESSDFDSDNVTIINDSDTEYS